MENIKYLGRLVAGDCWPLLVVGVIMILIIARQNCFCTKGTGRVFYREGSGFFVFLSSVAGCFHFADLMHSWIIGELVIVDEMATENPDNARLFSIIIAILLSCAVGVICYTLSQIVMLRRTEFLERRYFLKHIRTLKHYQNRY